MKNNLINHTINRDFNDTTYIDMTNKIALTEWKYHTYKGIRVNRVLKFDFYDEDGKNFLEEMIKTKKILNLKLHQSELIHVIIHSFKDNLYIGQCDDVDWYKFV